MPRRLSVRVSGDPALVINRTAFRAEKLVYAIRANRALSYTYGTSRIAYIGTTQQGAWRIASSAAWKGEDLLYRRGITQLELYVVTCRKLHGVQTWRKLERALLIRFREKFGQPPQANTTGKWTHWRDEKRYFTQATLDNVIDELGKPSP